MLFQDFSRFGAATVHEAFDRQGALASTLKPLHASMRVCGPAYTLKLVPGDNLGLHYAVAHAARGDVIVVDAGDNIEYGPFGDMLGLSAKTLGIGGIVIAGSVRDSCQLIEMDFPVFSKGVSIKGTVKAQSFDVGSPIVIDGVRIHPGDLVLGDADGVVIVPNDRIAAVLHKAAMRETAEASARLELNAGKTSWDLLKLADLQLLGKTDGT